MCKLGLGTLFKGAIKSSIFVVQKVAAPKNGVKFRQKSIGHHHHHHLLRSFNKFCNFFTELTKIWVLKYKCMNYYWVLSTGIFKWCQIPHAPSTKPSKHAALHQEGPHPRELASPEKPEIHPESERIEL